MSLKKGSVNFLNTNDSENVDENDQLLLNRITDLNTYFNLSSYLKDKNYEKMLDLAKRYMKISHEINDSNKDVWYYVAVAHDLNQECEVAFKIFTTLKSMYPAVMLYNGAIKTCLSIQLSNFNNNKPVDVKKEHKQLEELYKRSKEHDVVSMELVELYLDSLAEQNKVEPLLEITQSLLNLIPTNVSFLLASFKRARVLKNEVFTKLLLAQFELINPLSPYAIYFDEAYIDLVKEFDESKSC